MATLFPSPAIISVKFIVVTDVTIPCALTDTTGKTVVLPYLLEVTPEFIRLPSILISCVPSKFTPAPFTLPALVSSSTSPTATLIPIFLSFSNFVARSASPTKLPKNDVA